MNGDPEEDDDSSGSYEKRDGSDSDRTRSDSGYYDDYGKRHDPNGEF